MSDSAFYGKGEAGGPMPPREPDQATAEKTIRLGELEEELRRRAAELPVRIVNKGDLAAPTLAAQERQAAALEIIARWPADIFPVVSGLLSALGPVLVQVTEALAKLAALLDTPGEEG